MRRYEIEIREVHISTRLVEFPDDGPEPDRHAIIEAACDGDEVALEYSHTLEHNDHTVVRQVNDEGEVIKHIAGNL